ncbi:4-hydroxy-tetrahydrodipicolinate reductase [Candidatus Kinetoplastibacterium sorsogonicusi]|nr:4-hydroxy-tetrahydrodipicolinate reductase [Candidatus Kinetoplastibacterium sorsogonicusi]
MITAISGVSGKMGRMLIQTINDNNIIKLGAAFDKNPNIIGKDAGSLIGIQTNIIVTENLNELSKVDCLIDFSRPDNTIKSLEFCIKNNTNLVVGTTGFNEYELSQIKSASNHIAIFLSPNMSIGVNVTLKLLEIAAKMLKNDYDVEINEAHHNQKVDSPSGTAIKMGEVIANSWGQKLSDIAIWSRYGNIGPRKNGTIGFSTIRGGDIVGDHTVYFCGTGERIEISHKSNSRKSYAEGAIKAALFLENKSKGLYDMNDIIEYNR